ncbi:MAG: DUF4124 domain-containing protein [Cocleimonas sp.]|nr:DUF4124 domain-containing protein [Cocleimonas sp.]
MKKLLIIASTSLLLVSSLAQAGMYRWVDEKGEVHFSDKVPVAASRKAVDEINKSGGIKSTKDPVAEALAKLTLKENAEAIALEEAVRQAKLDKMATLKKRDDYLLSTYENKEELVKSFKTKIKLMKGNASILETQNAVLEKKLNKLLTNKSTIKNQAKKIVNITKTIEQYKKALQQNQEERLNISKNYQSDIKRYEKLTQ